MVIGSGIMAERLSGGNMAIALLANSVATGTGLAALITTFGPISGGHFNPVVTLVDASQAGVPWRDVPVYLTAQVIGAFAGAALAHSMFGEPVFVTILGCARARSAHTAAAVAAYITSAYWFTSSTSFANPAVTLARAASNTFAGIRPADAPMFIVAQLFGAASAAALFRWLVPAQRPLPEPIRHHAVEKRSLA
jgi:glycerol uptake facilitator-like aquaporin